MKVQALVNFKKDGFEMVKGEILDCKTFQFGVQKVLLLTDKKGKSFAFERPAHYFKIVEENQEVKEEQKLEGKKDVNMKPNAKKGISKEMLEKFENIAKEESPKTVEAETLKGEMSAVELLANMFGVELPEKEKEEEEDSNIAGMIKETINDFGTTLVVFTEEDAYYDEDEDEYDEEEEDEEEHNCPECPYKYICGNKERTFEGELNELFKTKVSNDIFRLTNKDAQTLKWVDDVIKTSIEKMLEDVEIEEHVTTKATNNEVIKTVKETTRYIDDVIEVTYDEKEDEIHVVLNDEVIFIGGEEMTSDFLETLFHMKDEDDTTYADAFIITIIITAVLRFIKNNL